MAKKEGKFPLELEGFKDLPAVERVKAWLKGVMEMGRGRGVEKGFDLHLLHSALLVSSATLTPSPTITFHVTVTPELGNFNGTIHGGAVATIFDVCGLTALSLTRRPEFWIRGAVSRSLNVVFLGAVQVGEGVEVRVEVMGVGRRLGRFDFLF
ncbi:hypothetical protein MMC24_006208 [Lignoscripta atroalba]|nr:hypothetical protein [Lignoscripta atroalba]